MSVVYETAAKNLRARLREAAAHHAEHPEQWAAAGLVAGLQTCPTLEQLSYLPPRVAELCLKVAEALLLGGRFLPHHKKRLGSVANAFLDELLALEREYGRLPMWPACFAGKVVRNHCRHSEEDLPLDPAA